MGNTIQVGYGSDRRGGGKKGLYGGRTGGKYLANGGFGGQPRVTFETISDEDWDRIFPKQLKEPDASKS